MENWIEALPDPPQNRAELDTAYVPPKTGLEHRLAQIWIEIFSLDQIGTHDNFFELGGDSLMATRLISRIQDVFKIVLADPQRFRSANGPRSRVAGTSARESKGRPSAVPLKRRGSPCRECDAVKDVPSFNGSTSSTAHGEAMRNNRWSEAIAVGSLPLSRT